MPYLQYLQHRNDQHKLITCNPKHSLGQTAVWKISSSSQGCDLSHWKLHLLPEGAQRLFKQNKVVPLLKSCFLPQHKE